MLQAWKQWFREDDEVPTSPQMVTNEIHPFKSAFLAQLVSYQEDI
jgi:hypothetical protein